MIDELNKLIESLQTGGPYAILVLLGWAYWKQNGYVQKLHEQILAVSTQSVQATTAMVQTIDSLKDALTALGSKLDRQ